MGARSTPCPPLPATAGPPPTTSPAGAPLPSGSTHSTQERDGDPARRAAGQPDLVSLIAEAMAMDVRLTVCQSGMALVRMTASDLVPQVRAGGLVSFLADSGPNDQLLTY